MGCAQSAVVEPDYEREERKGIPPRVDVPVVNAADGSISYRSATVGKLLEDGSRRFVLRFDNGGGTIQAVLKRPIELNVFSNFARHAEVMYSE